MKPGSGYVVVDNKMLILVAIILISTRSCGAEP